MNKAERKGNGEIVLDRTEFNMEISSQVKDHSKPEIDEDKL